MLRPFLFWDWSRATDRSAETGSTEALEPGSYPADLTEAQNPGTTAALEPGSYPADLTGGAGLQRLVPNRSLSTAKDVLLPRRGSGK